MKKEVSHKNDLLRNDVAETLETHNEHNDIQNEVVSDSRAIQIEGIAATTKKTEEGKTCCSELEKKTKFEENT